MSNRNIIIGSAVLFGTIVGIALIARSNSKPKVPVVSECVLRYSGGVRHITDAGICQELANSLYSEVPNYREYQTSVAKVYFRSPDSTIRRMVPFRGSKPKDNFTRESIESQYPSFNREVRIGEWSDETLLERPEVKWVNQ